MKWKQKLQQRPDPSLSANYFVRSNAMPSLGLNPNPKVLQQYPIPRHHQYDPTRYPTVLPILVTVSPSCADNPSMDVYKYLFYIIIVLRNVIQVLYLEKPKGEKPSWGMIRVEKLMDTEKQALLGTRSRSARGSLDVQFVHNYRSHGEFRGFHAVVSVHGVLREGITSVRRKGLNNHNCPNFLPNQNPTREFESSFGRGIQNGSSPGKQNRSSMVLDSCSTGFKNFT